MIKLDYSKALKFISDEEIANMKSITENAAKTLHEGTGAGNDFLGWVDLPENYDKGEFARIKECAKKIQSDSEVLVVVGIGGSYLGARAAIEMLGGSFYNFKENGTPKILFAGNSISSTYLSELLEYLKDKDFSVNIISKSGTTTEPAIAFRMLRSLLIEKYGDTGAKARIYATTDAKKGALKEFSDKEGYETFVIPDDVGGRFSVLTAVGLLPIAAAGINIDEIMRGAHSAMEEYKKPFEENICYQYAALRNILNRKGKDVEIMVNYEPSLVYFSEWWKQLFGESEGKNGIGIFPASVEYTADLHSMGQYIQDGPRAMMETVVRFKKSHNAFTVPFEQSNADGLNYIAGRDLTDIGVTVAEAVKEAHISGGVPNMVIEVEKRDEEGFASLVCFFEMACAISGYMSGVNPFDQPGVEAYKKNMFRMLGKPGC